MRNLKKTITAAVLLISFSAAGAALGNGASAASLEAKDPAGPVSNTGRDYRIALINAENSDGSIIHKPMQEEGQAEKMPARGSGEMRNRPRDGSGHHYNGRHERRFEKDDKDGGRRYEGRHEHRFDKDDKDGGHRYEGRHEHRFDKDDKDGGHRYEG
ncbi:hypothetical protein, partial [uncultured Dialister sp.]|uniref:hypothetical protein n=1 Tax=uncultured Dialister sp. TaxID=278064 RepID=UPI00261BC572